MELSGCPGIQLIALGGHIDPQHAFTYGDDALNQLRRYKADRLILSVDGVDAEGKVAQPLARGVNGMEAVSPVPVGAWIIAVGCASTDR